MYLVEPNPETLPLAGASCCVPEYEDGRVEVRHGDRLLPCRVHFDKDPRVTQADIVANKRLSAVLTQIAQDQQARDEELLARSKRTLRQKERIRAARARASAPVEADAGG